MPQRFMDAMGTYWAMDVNATTIAKVREEIGFDLMQLVQAALDGDRSLSDLLRDDPATLVSIIYLLCRETAQTPARTPLPDEFARALGGGALGRATRAMWESLVNHIPDSGQRKRLRVILGRADAITKKNRLCVSMSLI